MNNNHIHQPGQIKWLNPHWYHSGCLPHLDDIRLTQAVSFRLADTLPRERLNELEEELKNIPEEKQDALRRLRIEEWLDSGTGCCALRHPALAEVVENTLLFHHPAHYHLLAWCVMPNHVHVLIKPLSELSFITRTWKSFTGRWAMRNNAEKGLGIHGPALWQRESFDRYMRNGDHFYKSIAYIHNNPVKAGLCEKPGHWRWSSAWEGRVFPGVQGSRPAN